MNNEIYCNLFFNFSGDAPCKPQGFQRNSNERQIQNVDLNQNRMGDGNI